VTALRHITGEINSHFKTRISVLHVFGCEFNPRKRQFLLENHPSMKHLFADVAEVGSGTATDVKTGMTIRTSTIPVDLLAAGFSCKNASSCHPNRADYASCLVDESGSTGATWGSVARVITRLRPALLFLENVRGLTHSVADSSGTRQPPQVRIVENFLTESGYRWEWDVLSPHFFSIPQRRERWWLSAASATGHNSQEGWTSATKTCARTLPN